MLPVALAGVVLLVFICYSRKQHSMHPVDWFSAAYNANMKTIAKVEMRCDFCT